MDLQSLGCRGSFIASPSDGFCDPHRRHQILLNRRQYGIGADLHFRVAGMIIAAGQSKAGDGDNESGEMRQLRRTYILGGVHHDHTPNRWRFFRALATRAVNTRTTTTSAESIRPVGTTAVYPSRL